MLRIIRDRAADSIKVITHVVDQPMAESFSAIIVDDFRLCFAYAVSVFDPDAHLPKPNRDLIYIGACMIAGIRLAREKQVSVRVIPTINAIQESVELAHEVFNRVYRRVPEQINKLR